MPVAGAAANRADVLTLARRLVPDLLSGKGQRCSSSAKVAAHGPDVVQMGEHVGVEDFGPIVRLKRSMKAFCCGFPGWMWRMTRAVDRAELVEDRH